ncbi:MAG: response regulator [Sphingobacteriaceae bacterium]|nr:response regulator [Sphingobacteriaceae bacterium]
MNRIMILSSDQKTLAALKAALQGTYQLKVFPDCADIFSRIADYKPDLLIMDFYLSGTNSAAMSHQIKCNAETRYIPVISISENLELAKQCIKSGCDIFVQKPIDTNLLADSIRECLNSRRAESQL